MTERAEHSFALCLTHDVDRPYKTPFHAVYYAIQEGDPRHLRALSDRTNPYWQFETIRDLEAELGVRSAFYFLSEPPLWHHSFEELFDPSALVQAFGRYDVRTPALTEVVRELDRDGWEVGLHGSYHTATDRERLREEKRRIEEALGQPVVGGRQHYLNLAEPETWRHYRSIGLSYDASLGSATEYGFQYGTDVRRPFDDEFVVFPLTLMEQHLPDPGREFDEAWAACASLLDTAIEEHAVMTVLFHPRFFSQRDFPGYRRLYRRLVTRALERDAWVGPPGEYYETFLAPEADGVAAGPATD